MSVFMTDEFSVRVPSCNGNHVFIVDHGYPWLFHHGHVHVFIFHTNVTMVQRKPG